MNTERKNDKTISLENSLLNNNNNNNYKERSEFGE